MEPYEANDTTVLAEDTQEGRPEDENATCLKFREWFNRNKCWITIVGLAAAGFAIYAYSGLYDQDEEDEPYDDPHGEDDQYQYLLLAQDHDIALENRHDPADREMPITSGREVTSLVNGHFRNLPEGWNRSEAKEQEMLKKGLSDLPTNVTIVDPFSRTSVY